MFVFIGFIAVCYIAYEVVKRMEPYFPADEMYQNWPIVTAIISGIIFSGFFIVTLLAGWY